MCALSGCFRSGAMGQQLRALACPSRARGSAQEATKLLGSEQSSCDTGSVDASPPPRDFGSETNKVDLQRILGNSVSSCARAQSEADELVPETGPSGQEMLDACEGSDSALALEAVRTAGPKALNSFDDINRNALLLTAAEGHLEALRHLLQRGDFQGLGARNNIGSSALHLAAGNEQLEVCEALLTSERYLAAAPINARNDNGQTPLDFAAEFGDGVCSAVLEDKGGEASGRGTWRRGRVQAGNRRGPQEAIAEEGDGEDLVENDALSHGGSTDTGGMEGSAVGSAVGSDDVTDMGSLD